MGITATAVESKTRTDAPATSTQPAGVPVLLTATDIEVELRRLVRRLVAGIGLLHRSQNGGAAAVDRKVLLDLEVDGIRCVLTHRPAANRQTELRLTPREREVARMVAMGFTNAAIAGKLAVSPWTVSTHLRRIFAKLDVTTRAAMVAVIAAAETERLIAVSTVHPPAAT